MGFLSMLGGLEFEFYGSKLKKCIFSECHETENQNDILKSEYLFHSKVCFLSIVEVNCFEVVQIFCSKKNSVTVSFRCH